jgi:branched-subunit amino acid transport protein
MTTGSGNIIIGLSGGAAYGSAESGNLLLGSRGVSGDVGIARIGLSGTYAMLSLPMPVLNRYTLVTLGAATALTLANIFTPTGGLLVKTNAAITIWSMPTGSGITSTLTNTFGNSVAVGDSFSFWILNNTTGILNLSGNATTGTVSISGINLSGIVAGAKIQAVCYCTGTNTWAVY